MKWISLTTLLAIAASWSAPLSAQDFQQYFEELDVVLYQIQVNVRDKEGNHVSGLSKEDFEVILKGNPQRLEAVEEVSVDDWLMDNSTTIDEIPQQARRLFVFYFDLRYSTKRGLLAAQSAAREFVLDDMLPSDLIAVFTYNNLAGISMVQNFTSDQDMLLESLDTLGLGEARNLVSGSSGYNARGQLAGYLNQQDDIARSGALSDNTVGGTGALAVNNQQSVLEHFVEIAQFNSRAEDAIYEREVIGFLNAMEKFADGLRLIRGRKNLVWFSTGFDARGLVGAGNSELASNNELFITGQHYRVSGTQYGNPQLQHEMVEAVEHMQSSGTVIFAVDTSLASNDAGDQRVGLQTLNMFAIDTGGTLYQNENELINPLREVKEITNDYYLLSFYPDADIKRGKTGRLKVRINNRRDVDVFTSKGLMVEPDFRKLTDLEKQIHLSEYIGKDQIIRAIPTNINIVQIPQSDKLVKLSVGVELAGDYFLGKETRPVEVHTFAITRDTNQLFDRSYFQFKINPKKVQSVLTQNGIKYFANLFVKPGDYKIKVVVRDMDNGKVGSYIEPISVESINPELAGPAIVHNENWLMLRQSEEAQRLSKAGDLDFSYPFSFGGTNLVPRAQPIVDASASEMFFYLLSNREYNSESVPSVRAVIMDKDGTVIPIPANAIESGAEYRSNTNQIACVLKVNFQELKLERGQNYKLMTEFRTQGQKPLRSLSEFVVE